LADISIIIVNFRGWKRLSQCLDSLSVIDDCLFTYEVIIVDNQSNDGFIEQFRLAYPKFTFVLNSGNFGFANGCNLGVMKSKGSFLLFLNPDTIVNSDSLFAMLSEVRARKLYSIVSCCQITENGSRKRPYGRFLSPFNLTGWLRAIHKIIFRNGEKLFLQNEEYIFPDWVSGSVLMISRSSFAGLSGWDNDFWMYFEDVDLCRRASNKGGEIVLLKKSCIEHNHGGASRINNQVTALTKTCVNISRHTYISKHEKGFKAFYMHSFLIVNNLLFGLFPAILGIIFFFIGKLNIVTHTYFQLLSHYLNVLRSGTWLSQRSVNYSSKGGRLNNAINFKLKSVKKSPGNSQERLLTSHPITSHKDSSDYRRRIVR